MADEKNPIFPLDIFITILLLLPPKVLMKFICVCRTWKHLIKDPSFTNKYLKDSLSKGNSYLLYMSMKFNPMSFKLIDDRSFQESLELKIPFLSDDHNKSYVIVGSFNGLLCVSELENIGSNMFLCNPSIMKYKALSPPRIDRQRITNMVVGFAYHSEVHDYKVIRIIFEEACEYSKDERTIDEDIRVEVYSLSTDLWKKIQVHSFSWDIFAAYSGVVVNDSIHWVAFTEDNMVILSFDLKEEVFREIKMPNHNREEWEVLEFISEFNGALSIFFYCPVWHTGASDCELWVMNDYGLVESWTKLYTISLDGGVSKPYIFTNHGEIVLRDQGGNVLVYNFDTGYKKYLEIEKDSFDLTFVTFKNSLVLIEETDKQVDHEGEPSGRIVEEDPIQEGNSPM